MRPFVIGVGGGSSGAGKTTIACKLLEAFPGWGAIKCTKSSVFGSISDDIAVLSVQGKDTRRFLDAGAEKVLWVKSDSYDLVEVLRVAIDMLSHLKGVIVEGNSAIGALKPDAVVFVAGSDGEIKEGAAEVLGLADIVIFDREPPQGAPEFAKKHRVSEDEDFLTSISEIIRRFEDRT